MFRTLRFAAVAALVAGSMFVAGHPTSANLGTNISVIVELRDDPGAVYAAKSKQNGTTLSDDRLQGYRNGDCPDVDVS